MSFYYKHNLYEELYLFTRPDPAKRGAEALKDYEVCKSYILDNPKYEIARSSTTRQTRTHSCFSYCANGEDLNFLGDDRPQCVDLEPSQRDQIICLYPEEECEKASVKGEVSLSLNPDNQNVVLAPSQAIFAVLIASPF